MKDYYNIMQTFNEKHIPNLDIAVLGALELFMEEKPPRILNRYKHPLIIGSGNAEITGKILFQDIDAIYANESTYKEKLEKTKPDAAIIISASGGKDAPKIIKHIKKKRKPIVLLTTTKNSPAEKLLGPRDEVFHFPKQREPYTYNTSTYLGMILAKSKVQPKKIYEHILRKLEKKKLPDFSKIDRYYFILPNEYQEVCRMLHIKFIELFGRTIARDIETKSYAEHATTIIPSNEQYIVFTKNKKDKKKYSKKQLTIQLSKWADDATMIAIGYYIIGKIQGTKKPLFKEHLQEYTKKASKEFKQNIKAIVE
jgi:hypothetical protein